VREVTRLRRLVDQPSLGRRYTVTRPESVPAALTGHNIQRPPSGDGMKFRVARHSPESDRVYGNHGERDRAVLNYRKVI
jgi:hypothetical protein